MKVSIIGSGQVGSRMGKQMRQIGHDVLFFDVFDRALESLRKEGFSTTLDLKKAVIDTDISVIAVPTPLKEERFDLSFIEDVAKKCGEIMKEKNDYHVFVLKSTITPGVSKQLFIPLLEKHSGKSAERDFGVVYNPEFLTVIENTWTRDNAFKMTPDREGRIVLGGNNEKALDMAEKMYEPLGVPIFRTNTETAEAVKMTANSRLPLVVSFTNQITELLKEANNKTGLDIDVSKVIEFVSLDPRIGKYGSVFGKAFGGPCFKKDPNAFNTFLKETTGKVPTLINETIQVNKEIGNKYGVRE